MKISQVIVFTQRPELKMLLEIECKGMAGFSPIIRQGLDDFKSIIGLFESIDILIIDEPEDQETFTSLIDLVKNKIGVIKETFFLSKTKTIIEKAKVFGNQQIQELLTELNTIIDPASASEASYISIPIDSLLHFHFLPFDLFVKIGQDKFIRRVPANEQIDHETFATFLQKGVTDFYFEKKYNKDFSMMLINNMINKVEKDYESVDEKLHAANEVFHTTQQIISRLGFKPKLIEVCNSVIDQILGDVSGKKDNFSKFLQLLRSQRDLTFNYRLMELTSFVGTLMIEAVEKHSQEDKIKRIIFAAMFCDYALPDPRQLHIRYSDQLLKLSMAEYKEINQHALRGSELILNFQSAPIEVSTMIKQHHGSADGKGFPKEISPRLIPLSKCFMAAQELSYQILTESDRDPRDVVKDVLKKFTGTPLEEYLLGFEKGCNS